jgi:hypothetical protein
MRGTLTIRVGVLRIVTLAALLPVALAGFASTGAFSTPDREETGRVCSETCGALPTTAAPPAAVHEARDHAVPGSGSDPRRRLR